MKRFALCLLAGVGFAVGAFGLDDRGAVGVGVQTVQTSPDVPVSNAVRFSGFIDLGRKLNRWVSGGLEVQGAVFISPPIAFMDLSWLPRVPGLRLVVAGDQDDICPLADLQRLWEGEGAPEIMVIEGADHFFGGREEELLKGLRDFPL